MAPSIDRYRTRHKIEPIAGDRAYGRVTVCQVDGIRVHSSRGSGWYHDPGEVKAAEHGQTFDEVERHLELAFRVETAGGHTHVAVFAGRDEAHLAKCGDLTFENSEWLRIETRLAGLTTDGVISTTSSRPLAT